jgi:hypothetical protein
MSEHRIILVEKADDRHTPDEALIELTVRHGQCWCCKKRLYTEDEAMCLVTAHVDGSFHVQRFCSVNCIIYGMHGYESGKV